MLHIRDWTFACMVVASGLVATAASAEDRFDLECAGKLDAGGTIAPLPFAQTLSIDLASRQWCANGCWSTRPLVEASPGHLTLVDQAFGGGDARHVVTVDLGSGALSDTVVGTAVGSSPVAISARCERRPFSGLERRAPPANAPQVIASAVAAEDYPSAAIRAGHTGRVAFRVAIDAKGQSGECAIEDSSGDAELDYATCRLVATKMVFKAATDASGTSIAGTYVGALGWALPE